MMSVEKITCAARRVKITDKKCEKGLYIQSDFKELFKTYQKWE